jgi:MFS family permease
VLTQSSLGTGAGYVALLIVAYERFHSPWAISLVLLADFLPPMFLGPLFGAAADRWSRRWCAIVADVVRAGAFIGIGLADGFVLTLAFALMAGGGTALFRPSALAALPSLVAPSRSAPAVSLYGAITDIGFTLGPAVAAVALALMSPEWLLVANGATFAVSAVVLGRIPFGAAAEHDEGESSESSSLFQEAREGMRALARMRAMALILWISGAAMLAGGIFNVIELPFASDELDAGGSGYSALVAVFGLGFLAGSLRASSGGSPAVLKRRYLEGLILTGAGDLAAAMSPGLGLALAAFALSGFGNGVFVAYQRLLIQSEVPESLHGRTFAISDTLTSWGFAIAIVSGGALLTIASARDLFFLTGGWELLLALIAAIALRQHWVARKSERAQEMGYPA